MDDESGESIEEESQRWRDWDDVGREKHGADSGDKKKRIGRNDELFVKAKFHYASWFEACWRPSSNQLS